MTAAPVFAGAVPPFSDVFQADWSYPAIYRLVEAGIANGYGDGTFRGAKSVTRAEYAAMIVNVLGLESSNLEVPFEDVGYGAWYRAAVAAAFENQLIHGDGKNRFDPEAAITRQDAAVVLANGLDIAHAREAEERRVEFTDQREISPYAAGSIKRCVDLGLLRGEPKGAFSPQKPTTRGEAAAMIAAFAGSIRGEALEMPRVGSRQESALHMG